MQEVAVTLTERIQTLTAKQLAAVEDFVELLQSAEEHVALIRVSALQSEPLLAAIWSNPEDNVYDAL